MYNQPLGTLLKVAPTVKISKMKLIYKAVKDHSLVPIKHNQTCQEVLEIIEKTNPALLDEKLSNLLGLGQFNNNGMNKVVNILMLIMMVVMATGFAFVNICISYKTGKVLDWADMLIPLMGPLFIVWYDRGLLRKENRDFLLAMMGELPGFSTIEKVGNKITQATVKPNKPDF